MYYNYGGNSARDNVLFVVRKVKRLLYPLHCFAFVIAMIVYWDKQRLDSIRHISIWIIKAFSNLFLLQSWFPKSEFYFSFNAASWYLSTSVVLWFVFPYIHKVINKLNGKYGVVI